MVCVLNLSLPISHTIPVKFRSLSLYFLFSGKAAFLSHVGFSVTTKYGVKIHFQKFLLFFYFFNMIKNTLAFKTFKNFYVYGPFRLQITSVYKSDNL